jgi:hypothetical protein
MFNNPFGGDGFFAVRRDYTENQPPQPQPQGIDDPLANVSGAFTGLGGALSGTANDVGAALNPTNDGAWAGGDAVWLDEMITTFPPTTTQAPANNGGGGGGGWWGGGGGGGGWGQNPFGGISNPIDDVREGGQNAANAVGGAVQTGVNAGQTGVNAVGGAVQTGVNAGQTGVNAVGGAVQTGVNAGQTGVNAVGGAVQTGVNAGQTGVNAVGGAVQTGVNAGQTGVNAVGGAGRTVGDAGQTGVNAIGDAGRTVGDAGQTGVNAIGDAGRTVGDAGQTGVNAIGDAGRTVGDAGQTGVNAIGQGGKAAVDTAKQVAKTVINEAVKTDMMNKLNEEAKKISENLTKVDDLVNAAKDTTLQAGASRADIIAYNMARFTAQVGEQAQAEYAPFLETPAPAGQDTTTSAPSTQQEYVYKDIEKQADEKKQELTDYLRKQLLTTQDSGSKSTASPSCKYDASKAAKETFIQLYENQVNGTRLPNLTDAISITAWIRKAYHSNGVVGKVIVVLVLLAVVGMVIVSIISFAGMPTEKKLATLACFSILLVISFIFKMN